MHWLELRFPPGAGGHLCGGDCGGVGLDTAGPRAALDLSSGAAGGHPEANFMKYQADPSVE